MTNLFPYSRMICRTRAHRRWLIALVCLTCFSMLFSAGLAFAEPAGADQGQQATVITPEPAGHQSGSEDLGHQLPLWSIIPFIGILLSIAVVPLVNAHWWERHMWKVSVFWSLVFFVPFWIVYGGQTAIYRALHVYVLDYIPFIILSRLISLLLSLIVRAYRF